MRIAICFRHCGNQYQLVWLNEDNGGIYVGFRGGQEEVHNSYHKDGRRHTKMGSEYLLPFKDAPIAEHRGVKQLHSASLSITKDWFSARNAYPGDEKTETVVLLEEDLFSERSRCSLDVWLFDRASESEFYRLAGKLADIAGFRTIVAVAVSLGRFPSHKLALTLRSELAAH